MCEWDNNVTLPDMMPNLRVANSTRRFSKKSRINHAVKLQAARDAIFAVAGDGIPKDEIRESLRILGEDITANYIALDDVGD